MSCLPTPVTTLFSTSTSFIASTITTSSAVLITPSPSISIWITTICSDASSSLEDARIESAATSISASSSFVATSTFSIPNDTSSNDEHISSDTNTFAGSSSNSVISSELPLSTGASPAITATFTISNSQTIAGTPTTTSSSSSFTSAVDTTQLRKRQSDLGRRQQQDGCRTITSSSTVWAAPTTSWSLVYSTFTDSTSLIEVPIETIMGSCDSVSSTATMDNLSITTTASELHETRSTFTVSSTSSTSTSAPSSTDNTSISDTSIINSPITSGPDTTQTEPSTVSSEMQGSSKTEPTPFLFETDGKITSSASYDSLASHTEIPTINHNTYSASFEEQSNSDNQSNTNTSNKGSKAGAIVGGLLGALALLALIAFLFRWWTKKRRTEKTNSLRISWFNGHADKPLDRNDSENEKRRSTLSASPYCDTALPSDSRFSTASSTSRSVNIASLLIGLRRRLLESSIPILDLSKSASGNPKYQDEEKGSIPLSVSLLTGISQTIKTLPKSLSSLIKKAQSLISKQISLPKPMKDDNHHIAITNEERFQSSKLLPIFSKFRSIRQSLKILNPHQNTDLRYIRKSQVNGIGITNNQPAWAERFPSQPPVPVHDINELWINGINRNSMSHGGDERHIVFHHGNQDNTDIQKAEAGNEISGFDNCDGHLEYSKVQRVELRHLTWGSSYAPPRGSILNSDGLFIDNRNSIYSDSDNNIRSVEDGNSIYSNSRTSLSHSNHGHGGGGSSNNSNHNHSISINHQEGYDEWKKLNLPIPPQQMALNHISDDNNNSSFPRNLVNPISSNGSYKSNTLMDKRYSPQQLPPLPEYLEPSTHNHSLQGNFTLSVPDNNASSKRITRSTSNFSGMWEYSAYVGNSIRGSDMFDYKNDQEVPDRFLNSQEDNYATVPQPKRMSFFGTPTEKSQEMISNLEPSHFVPIPQHPQQSIYDPNLNNFPSTPYNPISHHTPPSINNPIGNDNEQDRLTKAWYEKPLWDNRTSSYPYAPGQGQHENRIRDPISILLPPRYNNPIYQDYDFLRGPDVPPNGRKSRIRKSTKSVRWEDENCGTNVVNNSVARVL